MREGGKEERRRKGREKEAWVGERRVAQKVFLSLPKTFHSFLDFSLFFHQTFSLLSFILFFVWTRIGSRKVWSTEIEWNFWEEISSSDEFLVSEKYSFRCLSLATLLLLTIVGKSERRRGREWLTQGHRQHSSCHIQRERERALTSTVDLKTRRFHGKEIKINPSSLSWSFHSHFLWRESFHYCHRLRLTFVHLSYTFLPPFLFKCIKWWTIWKPTLGRRSFFLIVFFHSKSFRRQVSHLWFRIQRQRKRRNNFFFLTVIDFGSKCFNFNHAISILITNQFILN